MSKPPSARAPNKLALAAAEQWISGLPAETADLVKQAWQAANRPPGDFATDFYSRLFAAAPAVVGLFSGDMTEQRHRLTHTLDETVALIHAPQHLLLLLRASGVRHHHYAVKQAYFSAMRDVLIDTMAARAGASFAPEHRAAWEAFFDNMATVMQHGMASAAKQ